MATRRAVLANDQIYHVFNKSVNGHVIFGTKGDYERALLAIDFYQFTYKNTMSLSKYLNLSRERRQSMSQNVAVQRVEILGFCLMPNHYHLLLKQKSEYGISGYMSNWLNSFSRYLNESEKLDGRTFKNKFKAVRIESHEQLLHVCRYIELNPYTGFLTKDRRETQNYAWSSLSLRLRSSGFCLSPGVLESFMNPADYLEFVWDRADYQRSLKLYKHLLIDE